MLGAMLDAGVDFLIVGAHALAVHGIVRATGDIDLLVRPTPGNAHRVITALQAFGAPIAAHGISARDFSVPGAVYQIGLPPRRIDILTEISGVPFGDAWDSKVQASIAGLQIAVLGRDALLRNKRATGREKDLADVAALSRSDTGSDTNE